MTDNPKFPSFPMALPDPPELPSLDEAAAMVVGLTLQDAQRVVSPFQVVLRITEFRGKPLVVTMDYHPRRLNVATDPGGVITKVFHYN